LLAELLEFFPDKTYPLILVYDPDGLLNEEAFLSALEARGYRLVFETDPILLRQRIENTKPFNVKQPVIVRTEQALNNLPYDLWQSGKKIELGLHLFFPTLDYPTLQQLTPPQFWALSRVKQPTKRLGENKTAQFVLKHVFQLSLDEMQTREDWLVWLDEFHQSWEMICEPFLQMILQHPNAQHLANLKSLLLSKSEFLDYLQSEWGDFVQGHFVKEASIAYQVDFSRNMKLQNLIGRAVSQGRMSPIQIPDELHLPYWVKPGVLGSQEDRNARRIQELEQVISTQDIEQLSESRWDAWLKIAWTLSEYQTLTKRLEPKDHISACSDQIDQAFLNWLKDHYASLATQSLPKPHHLMHVPQWIAYQRRKEKIDKTALIVMDGMALSDWRIIRAKWQPRNPDWQIEERAVLAQIPTITAISRQALVSGLRPIDFMETFMHNRAEGKLWSTFWQDQNLSPESCFYSHYHAHKIQDWVDQPHLKSVCLIETKIDEIMHNTTQGDPDFYASLEIWLANESKQIERTIDELLTKGFTVYISSDHGHVEAQGFGNISEGLTAVTRGKRARIYTDPNLAEKYHKQKEATILWHHDSLLPHDIYVLMPSKAQAFASDGKIVVAHGGMSIQEMIVPLIKIEKDFNA
jgi:hypothetical protein